MLSYFFKSSRHDDEGKQQRHRASNNVYCVVFFYILFILYYGSIDDCLRFFSIIFQLNLILPFENWKNEATTTTAATRIFDTNSLPQWILFHFILISNHQFSFAHFCRCCCCIFGVIISITARVYSLCKCFSLLCRMQIVCMVCVLCLLFQEFKPEYICMVFSCFLLNVWLIFWAMISWLYNMQHKTKLDEAHMTPI